LGGRFLLKARLREANASVIGGESARKVPVPTIRMICLSGALFSPGLSGGIIITTKATFISSHMLKIMRRVRIYDSNKI
jgi:hypothetical protein